MDFTQDNWAGLLPSAEFAVNAAVSEFTRLSPFIITREYQLRMSFNEPESAETAKKHITLRKVKNLAELIKKV